MYNYDEMKYYGFPINDRIEYYNYNNNNYNQPLYTENVDSKPYLNSVFNGYENIGNLDYVSCWYKKCLDFIKDRTVTKEKYYGR